MPREYQHFTHRYHRQLHSIPKLKDPSQEVVDAAQLERISFELQQWLDIGRRKAIDRDTGRISRRVKGQHRTERREIAEKVWAFRKKISQLLLICEKRTQTLA